MWARERRVFIVAVLFSFMLTLQPAASSSVSISIPTENDEIANAGITVKEVHESYIIIDVSTANPDIVHVPIYVLSDGTKVAKGVLQKTTAEEEVVMPLGTQQNPDQYTLVMKQDWPQNWDKLVIKLGEQDWPQYKGIIIPLDFQDWPQNWLPALLV